MSGRTDVRERLTLLDLLRLFASFAVVYHHMRGDFLLDIGGVALFLLILFGLTSSGSPSEPLGLFALRKARFLLVPWVRWSLIYLAVLVLGDLENGRALFGRLHTDMFIVGGHLSLWFLPFAATAVIASRCLQRGAVRLHPPAAMLLAAVLAVLATEVVTVATSSESGWGPLRSWVRSAPALLWGLALGQSLRIPKVTSRAGALAAVTLVSTLASLYAPSGDDIDSISRRFALTIPLVCLGFTWKPRLPAFVPTLAGLCFGIYVVHSLVGMLLWHAFDVMSWPGLLHTSVAWGTSALLVAGMRKVGVPWHELAAPEQRKDRAGPRSLRPTSTELAPAERRAA